MSLLRHRASFMPPEERSLDSGSPPMPDGTPPNRKAGWFASLLNLGNDNKLIAAATLVTLATGVPYLVWSAVGVFTAEEDSRQAMAELIVQAISDAKLQVSSDADAHAMSSRLRDVEDIVREQQQAIEAYGATALAVGATVEEQRRVADALQEYNIGRPESALADLRRIAREQEARGASEDAARTLRFRAALQIFPDGKAALEDYQHAERLYPGDAQARFAVGDLLYDHVSKVEAGEAFLACAELAAGDGDRALRGKALLYYAYCYGIGFGWSEETLARREWALREAVADYTALLDEDPYDLESLRLIAEPVAQLALLGAEDFDALLALLVEKEAAARAAVAADGIDAALRARALGDLAIARGRFLHLRGDTAGAEAAFVEGVRWARESLRLGRADVNLKIDVVGDLYYAADYFKSIEDFPRAVELFREVVVVSGELGTAYGENPYQLWALASARRNLGIALFGMEDYAGADEQYTQGLEEIRRSVAEAPESIESQVELFYMLVRLVQVRLEVAPATAGALMDDAEAWYQRLQGTPGADPAAQGLPYLEAYRARLAEEATAGG